MSGLAVRMPLGNFFESKGNWGQIPINVSPMGEAKIGQQDFPE
jgi:hypothetical protein